MDTPRLLIPYDEAAQLLGGISRSTIYNLIDTQKLIRVCIGRRGFITRDSLDGYVAEIAAAATH